MSCELGATQTSLAAYYKFNQGVGSGTNTSVTTLTDASGNNNTGTLSSFALTGATSNFVTTGGVTTGTTCTAIASVAIAANPSGTIAVGTSVTFTATAINVGTPQYKWQKNGVDISGATASTYTSATLADADIITCQLTNSGLSCTAKSNPVAMIVTTPAAALNFDGGSNKVSVSGINLQNTSFTIEFWAKRDALGNNFIAGQGATGAANQALHIGFIGTTFYFTSYGNDLIIANAGNDLNWHQWACVWDIAT